MTILASNSITVSKVDDGTITHTAWSYSADGADRFTTVYPNLNLLKGTKTPKSITGNNVVNQGALLYSFDNNSTLNNQGFSVNDTVTIEFDWSATNPASGQFNLQWMGAPWSGNTPVIKPSSTNGSGHVISMYNIRAVDIASTAVATGIGYRFDNVPTNTVITFSNVIISKSKTSQPHMPSSSEVTTADWPKYIGHYTDFTQADSTNPSDYTWGLMRGDDGVGIKTTDITYANSTSGTTAPSTGWTSSVPALVKGQYLWTKTVWTYTDTSSKTGYSVSYISKDGTNGTDGTSGIIVSSVAPASPQNGQLWQDTSTTPQLVKKWSGSSWVIWELYAENLKANTLETVSSKIGALYNEFTLEDGTIGTLHIGNSEYRINSQLLVDGFLLKENIFFDPDGLNFNFEGPTASSIGYGSYRKSGSDFYLQNKQRASYTVSGIDISNESAGYSIKIDNITYDNKMSFVSENGQGFEFTGPVSFNGVPMNTTSSTSVALFYGLIVDFRRQGNLVVVSVARQGRTTATTGEAKLTNEKVPSGYRPSYEHFFNIKRNIGNDIVKDLIMSFDSSGSVRITIGETGTAMFSGSTSYYTNDPLP